MRRLAVACLVALSLDLLLSTFGLARTQEQPFQLACSTLPFEAIKKEDRHIDDVCDVAGDATQTNHQAQNRAKNNFCATGNAALATSFTFTQLQSKAEAALSVGASESERRHEP